MNDTFALFSLGDLFVDGKVIHRPQFQFNNNRQQSRTRPRPRFDKRRETMAVERNEPMQRENWVQRRGEPSSRPMGGQDSFENGGRDPSMNQGQFDRGNA